MSSRYQSAAVDPSPLGQPLTFEFSGRTAPNRFMKAAITERLATWSPTDLHARGVPTPELINVYSAWGRGRFGVILTGNILTDLEHLEAMGNPIIPHGAPFTGPRFEAFKKMGAEAKRDGALVVAQLNHPGRQTPAEIQKHPISASALQLKSPGLGRFAPPRAATEDDIARVTAGFAHAAEYLDKAGYDGVQLHAAHGYLLAQFLSRSTNRRTDRYGGSLENRARLLLEIAAAVRARVRPGFVLGVKLNSVEFQENGMEPEEAQRLCELLEEHRFDFVELSGGTFEKLLFQHERESTKAREAFFLDFAEQITPSLSRTKSYITGGLRTVGAMVGALGACDGIGLARPICQEFDLPRKILAGEVAAAVEQRVDPGDFALTSWIAGTQVRQVGSGRPPIDMSDEAMVARFRREMGPWLEKVRTDTEGKAFGWIDLTPQASL